MALFRERPPLTFCGRSPAQTRRGVRLTGAERELRYEAAKWLQAFFVEGIPFAREARTELQDLLRDVGPAVEGALDPLARASSHVEGAAAPERSPASEAPGRRRGLPERVSVSWRRCCSSITRPVATSFFRAFPSTLAKAKKERSTRGRMRRLARVLPSPLFSEGE